MSFLDALAARFGNRARAARLLAVAVVVLDPPGDRFAERGHDARGGGLDAEFGGEVLDQAAGVEGALRRQDRLAAVGVLFHPQAGVVVTLTAAVPPSTVTSRVGGPTA